MSAKAPVGRSRVRLLFNLLGRVLPKGSRLCISCVPVAEDGVLALMERAVAERRGIDILGDAADWQHALSTCSWAAGADITFIPKRSRAGLLASCRARQVVVTHGLWDYASPLPGQTILNLWHGESGVKPIARFDGDFTYTPTWAPACGSLGRASRAAEFGLHPAQVPMTGAPRNDRMDPDRADVEAIRSTLSAPGPIVTWLPTYRTSTDGSERSDGVTGVAGLPLSAAELEQLDLAVASAGITLVIKPHPLAVVDSALSLQSIRFLQTGTAEFPFTLYPLLAATDALVTDVSSVWIDYLLLDRPIIGFMPDLAQYRRSRGILLEPYDALFPGPFVGDIHSLVTLLRSVAKTPARATAATSARDASWAEKRATMRQLTHANADFAATDRVWPLLSTTPDLMARALGSA